jgi:acetyl-CoA acetyltransferase
MTDATAPPDDRTARDVFIIGSHSTSFGRKSDETFKQLTQETVRGVLVDAQHGDGRSIDIAYFGNCAMHGVKQGTIRGQACTIELVDAGVLPARMPIINVEGACATGSMALHCAWKDIRSGASELALAIGVEKLFLPKAATDPAMKKRMMSGFMNGVDNFDLPRLFAEYGAAAAYAGLEFRPGEDRSFFMDTYAIQAGIHMKRYGTTARQIATAAAKSHDYGALNPLAQY